MNFSINREILLQNLTNVSKALSSKIQMPGLAGIKFEVYSDHMLLTASNNEISIQTCINDLSILKIMSYLSRFH